MDPKALETAFKKYGEKVKAVLVVHLYGLSADMDEIIEICSKYGAIVIEDAAESLGTTYKGSILVPLETMEYFHLTEIRLLLLLAGEC